MVITDRMEEVGGISVFRGCRFCSELLMIDNGDYRNAMRHIKGKHPTEFKEIVPKEEWDKW